MQFPIANEVPSGVNSSLLSDLELARMQHPAESDSALIRRLAINTVRELTLVAPVDPGLVASYRGIARIEEADQPWAGCLTHDGSETVARVRASDSPRRKRFSALHEVKHTYLPGFAVTQYRCTPSPTATRRKAESVETLADIGASELLLPRDEFRGDLAGNLLRFDLIERLADRYQASLTATALRAVSLSQTDSLLVCVEESTKPSQPNAQAVPRIRWSSAKGAWPFIPRFKSVPSNTPIHRSFQGELVEEAGSIVGITNSPIDNLYLSCRPYPYLDDHGEPRLRVLCLATHI